MTFFMGQELIQEELPPNSPKPSETPVEGVIMTDVGMDGSTRKYLYRAIMGLPPEETLISETRGSTIQIPEGLEVPDHAIFPENAVFSGIPNPSNSLAGSTSPMRLQGASKVVSGIPVKFSSPVPASLSMQAAAGPLPGMEVVVPNTPKQDMKKLGGPVSLSNSIESVKPVIAKPVGEASRLGEAAVQERRSPMLGQISSPLALMGQEEPRGDSYPISNPLSQALPISAPVGPLGAPSSFAQNMVPLRTLGQQTEAVPQENPQTCPGAIEMPDGRVIEPGDAISLQDLCAIIPLLVKSLTNFQGAQGLAPGQQVPVVGAPDGVQAVPTSSSFGPATGVSGQGAFARGGGGGFVGGGGGAPGPAGRTGAQGPPGPAGPPGPGSTVETPVVKTDGDFVAGPGSFVPVPGTTLTFSVTDAGIAVFYVTATLGRTNGQSGFPQSTQIGIRIDGVDHPLITRLIHTFAGGVAEFMIGQTFVYPISLSAGPHTAEIVLRGLAPGEFVGTAIGTSGAVAAIPEVPLIFTVAHN